jgi:hypothetical protein
MPDAEPFDPGARDGAIAARPDQWADDRLT